MTKPRKAPQAKRRVRRDSKGNAVPRATPTRKMKPEANAVLRKFLLRNTMVVEVAQTFDDLQASDDDVLTTLSTLADLYGYKLVQVANP